MKNFLTGILILLTGQIFGQQDLSVRFKDLYIQKKYEEIISYTPKDTEEISAKAYYYIAMSYYMKEQDDNAIKYFDFAINKGPVDHDMYFYKGMTLYYKGKHQEALPYFDKAIEMRPNEPDFYGGKGEVFYKINLKDSALIYFAKATALPKCKTKYFLLAGELYQDKNENNKALSTYEVALSKLDQTSKDYQSILFNVGLMNQLIGNIEKAKDIFEKLLSIYPNDFHCMTKLIQTYYTLNQLDSAKPYIEKIYEAHKKNKLPDIMKDMFCFAQFEWNNKRILAYELFNEIDNGFKTIKYQFFVTDNKGNIEYIIQSESSPAIRMSEGKYILAVEKDNNHYSYWSYKFNDDFEYEILKGQIIKILNGEIEPDAIRIRN